MLAEFETCFSCVRKYTDGRHFSISEWRGYQVIEGYFWKIVSISQRPGGGTLKTKCWLCLFLHPAQNPTPSSEYCCLFPLGAHCNPYLLLFTLWQASVPCVWCILENMSYRDWCFCLFDEMSFRENVSVAIRSLTILRVWRTLEQREHPILQIMFHCSWSVVSIESGSNQLLTTWTVEAPSLISLCWTARYYHCL
jgi:hypothetical protein